MNGSAKGVPAKEEAVPSPKESPPASKPWIVEDRSVDQVRPLRVVIMGAGISGIVACIRFAQRIPEIDLCVYEKNADVGGTWFENRYPGCACGKYYTISVLARPTGIQWLIAVIDIPAHTYQATFAPNPGWTQFYASAKEIWQYWKDVAQKYGCYRYMKFKQKVVEAIWDDNKAKWCLKVENLDDGSIHADECDVFISAQGSLNKWKWPDIPGLHDFKGKLVHTAKWDESYDYKVWSNCNKKNR